MSYDLLSLQIFGVF